MDTLALAKLLLLPPRNKPRASQFDSNRFVQKPGSSCFDSIVANAGSVFFYFTDFNLLICLRRNSNEGFVKLAASSLCVFNAAMYCHFFNFI